MGVSESNILIIDDNKEIRESLELFLGRHFSNIASISSPNTLVNTITTKNFDVILLDMNFSPGKHSGNEGIFWLREILKLDKSAVIILITAYGKVKLAVEGIKEGAFDFLLKPWENEKLLSTIKAGIKLRKSSNEVEELKGQQLHLSNSAEKDFMYLGGKSASMKKVEELIAKVAKTDANVLITGENGTGKEVIARQVHQKSNRSKNIFMPVDLSALTETLFESELFGYVKGAFTDAKEDRIGKIEVSNTGTLFLDEIGNLPVHLQSKLLTVIQTRLISKIGATQTKSVDFRLICATNKVLQKMIKEGTFREDLLFRINTVHIQIPPLRERTEDIIPLCNYFLDAYKKKYNKNNLKLSKQAELKLKQYSWPGNIRELKHTIERAVILSDNSALTFNDFTQLENELNEPRQDILKLTDLEKEAIQRAIKKSNGNMSKAADMLGISRTTLYFKISKYGLQ